MFARYLIKQRHYEKKLKIKCSDEMRISAKSISKKICAISIISGFSC